MGNESLGEPSASGNDTSFIRELICRFEEEVGVLQIDTVIEEAAFSLFVNGELLREMTCSPWHIPELVVGSLFTSSIIDSADQVTALDVDEDVGVISVSVASPSSSRRWSQDTAGQGAGSDAVVPRSDVAPMITPKAVSSNIEFLEGNSHLFHRTGGVHSAAIVDGENNLLAWFEDIGRHNALDKLAGWCLMNHVDASDKVLLFSGRIPREIIARAIRMGFPVIISPGAPTNLSIDLACKHGVTLIGFAKNGRFNVYTHTARIKGPHPFEA